MDDERFKKESEFISSLPQGTIKITRGVKEMVESNPLFKITVEEVLAAKEYCGLTLVTGTTFDYSSNCGCPLTVLYLQDTKQKMDQIKIDGEVYDWAYKQYGSSNFTHGFAVGFDHGLNQPSFIDNLSGEEKIQGDLGKANGVYIYLQLKEMGEIN